MENLSWEIVVKIIIAVTGIYEVLLRVIPTLADWTILGNIIKFLRWLSDYLNNLKKK